MEMPFDIKKILTQFGLTKEAKKYGNPLFDELMSDNLNDLIDVDKISFDNDETWLNESSQGATSHVDINEWLQQSMDSNEEDEIFKDVNLIQTLKGTKSLKNIDTRTFTRPKKRYVRPSIEKFNEDLLSEEPKMESITPVRNLSYTKTNCEVMTPMPEAYDLGSSTKPLQFNLAESMNTYYLEKMLENSENVDSFQNMSPPSLVNSMCSSTFTNLMESSFIKNDPTLRQIRDTDYTETVLLQDFEPPLFQSLTESLSSINSDSPESFLKKISSRELNLSKLTNEKKDFSENSAVDTSFTQRQYINANLNSSNDSDEYLDAHSDEGNLSLHPKANGTYRKSTRLSSATFRKSDFDRDKYKLDKTFEGSLDKTYENNHANSNSLNKSNDLLNSTITIESPKLIKRRMKSPKHNMGDSNSENVYRDLNRLSYSKENHDNQNYTVIKDVNRQHITRSSCDSQGSADSLNHSTSSLSSSSKGSNKMLNLEEVEAIADMQEKSLHIMSTPKPNFLKKLYLENNMISPINKMNSEGPFSDSDVSSNDEYKSVKSSLSKTSIENHAIKQTRSLVSLPEKTDLQKPRGINTLAKTGGNLRSIATGLRGSYTSLHGSHTNLYPPKAYDRSEYQGSNLKTMKAALKSSYTNLRPINTHLPVAPPPVAVSKNLNTTAILSRATNPNVTQNIDDSNKIAQVPPIPREPVLTVGDGTFIKPAVPRMSCLPRPVGSATSIPRPVSKIPGPRSARSLAPKQTLRLGRHVHEEFY